MSTKPRYILPTGKSLLVSKCLEMMHAHLNNKDYKYDDRSLYRISEATVDQNTLVIADATEGGRFNEGDKLS